MRKLISELLDFQKQEEGGLKLKVEEHNMVSFVHQIYTSFHEIASQKEIEYHFKLQRKICQSGLMNCKCTKYSLIFY